MFIQIRLWYLKMGGFYQEILGCPVIVLRARSQLDSRAIHGLHVRVSIVMGVPLVFVHFRLGFSLINHSTIGVPPFTETSMWVLNHGSYLACTWIFLGSRLETRPFALEVFRCCVLYLHDQWYIYIYIGFIKLFPLTKPTPWMVHLPIYAFL